MGVPMRVVVLPNLKRTFGGTHPRPDGYVRRGYARPTSLQGRQQEAAANKLARAMRDREIVRRYQAGQSGCEIATQMGLTFHAIYYVLSRDAPDGWRRVHPHVPQKPVPADLPRTVAQARAQGSRYYRRDRPCRHGHTAHAYTSSGHCHACLLLANRRRQRQQPRTRVRLSLEPEPQVRQTPVFTGFRFGGR